MATKKRALGRGLENFIKDIDINLEDTDDKTQSSFEIEIEKIQANSQQPRKDFDPKMLKELADSIKEVGILQPLIVEKKGEDYHLIAGERRLRAAKIAGLDRVPVILVNLKEEEVDKIALIENIQREDLNPLEEAMAYDRLKKLYSYTQEDLASKLGKSRSYIANTMRLLNLEEEVKDLLAKGDLNVSQAKILLSIKDPKKQVEKARQIVKKGQTVDQTQRSLKKDPEKTPYEVDLMDRLMDRLGTKAQMRGRGKNRKLIIDLYTEDDLTRVVDLILGGEDND